MKKVIIFCLALIGMACTQAHQTAHTNQTVGAYLEISLKIDEADRPAAAGVYVKYKQPFLEKAQGAISKELLLRTDDVQVLHAFKTQADAEAYLKSDLFNKDVVTDLKLLLKAAPEVRIYTVFEKK